VIPLTFVYIDLRNGSLFWPIWAVIEGAIGLAFVIAGTRYRRTIGATRLGQRDLDGIARQERRDAEEERRVA